MLRDDASRKGLAYPHGPSYIYPIRK
jgi:hypothetical protein